MSVIKALEELSGISTVEYDIEGEQFQVVYNPQSLRPEQMIQRLVELGQERGLPYTVTVLASH